VTSRAAPRLFGEPLAVWERDALVAALTKVGLPAADVTTPGKLFWRFVEGDVPVGFGGLEVHGGDALIRSIVTLPPLRERGVGRAIVTALEREAALHRCHSVYLLTTSAAPFFAQLGYAPCERNAVPPAISATQEFARLCPADAAVLVKTLA
jgi:N-acetylglutamate synthase-like GNAT family acetyltransferase